MLEFFRDAAAAACLVDALRGSMIVGGTSAHALGASFGVMPLAFALLLALASKLYPGLAPQADPW